MNIYKFFIKMLLCNFSLSFFLYIIIVQYTCAKEVNITNLEEYGFSIDKLKKIDQVFNKAIDDGEIPGATIAISRYGKVVYKNAFGLQDPQKKIPMSLDSIFRIYSMTKPIISVATMILNEKGKLYLNENIDKYISDFTNMNVSVENKINNNEVSEQIVKADRKIKIHNLLTHTSGLTYGSFGNSHAKERIRLSEIGKLNLEKIFLDEYVRKLSKYPLAYHPGTTWEYGRSIEVLGRVIEVSSNTSLDNFLKNNIFMPLDMKDTAFFVEESKWNRIAEPFIDSQPKLINIKKKPNFFTGGHGLVSTIDDYMKFCTMLLNLGKVNNKNFLSRKTIEYMTSNHLGSNISRDTELYLPGPGYGFGLGFAVRESNGLSSWPGSEGEYFWAGYAGTYFWIDPKEELIVVSMTQSVTNRMKFRLLLRNLVYQAIIN